MVSLRLLRLALTFGPRQCRNGDPSNKLPLGDRRQLRKALDYLLAVMLAVVTLCLPTASAQEFAVSEAPPPRAVPPGVNVSELKAARARAAQARAEQAKGDKGKPDKEKPEDGKSEDDKSEKGKDDKKDEEKDDSIKRPKVPPRVPDPREFDVRPDEKARLRFNFHGQPWPDVLEWLAAIGGYSLDWQELPDDYINFTTDQYYTVPETRDLFNRLLFDRGYTMVLQDQVMSVVRISKLDPSLLPRVEDESQLMDLSAHDFVKITFELPDELKADKAAEDVKPLLSTHSKVQPLLSTNRLLVIDIVANLRAVSRLVNAEHAAATGNTVPREFPVRYARAEHVADQIMILLGLDPASRRTPQELQVEQQRLQLFTQMQQKGKDVTKFLRKGDGPQVFLAVNGRRNSILANAPRAELAIIERSIELLDIPSDSMIGSMTGSLSMEKYQLVTLSPQSIVSALEEIGDLDPRTQLKTDSDARTVFAHATARDHEKIRAMIDRLDGTGRQFEVIWLRRLPADAVAATIQTLMVGKKDEKEDNRRSMFYYPYYRSSRGDQSQKPHEGFRVDADIENNRLLLWANEEELQEVRNFLAKLGEIPGETGNPRTVRVLDARGEKATLRLLDELRKAWPAIGPNELQIHTAPRAPAEEDERERPEDHAAATADPDPGTTAVARRPVRRTRALESYTQLAQLTPPAAEDDATDVDSGQPETDPADNKAGNPTEAPPITITVNEDGRIIISSPDTQALDRLEGLLAQIAPPPKNYRVFYLKNALASLVTLNLEEYFEDEGNFDSQENWMRAYYGFDFKSNDKSGGGLAKRRTIRFIYDYDSNSILVRDASPDQLETVEALIEIYDKAPTEDSISARRFQIFKLKYARAETISKTIKEVYRDLLSSKDKEFEKGKGDKEQSSQRTSYYRIYGGSSSENKKPTKVKASFAGALSIGVDDVSNTLIVSAQEDWMPSIAEMILHLDEEAKPYKPSVEVLTSRVSAATLQKALSRAFSENGGKQPGAAKPRPDNKPKEGQEGKPKTVGAVQVQVP